MRSIVFIIAFLLSINFLSAQSSQADQQQTSLAIRYYNAKDYEKAVSLLYSVYEKSKNTTYFRYYIDCLINLNRYEDAESQVQKEINKQKTIRPEYYVDWGRILRVQKKNEEAEEKFREAIDKLPKSKSSYILTANAFLNWGEYDYAKQTYLKGREVLVPEKFDYELARAYTYLRDYENMLESYMDLVRQQEEQLTRVQSALSAMNLDNDSEMRDQFRGQILKRIQAEPDIIGYNRLLIWFFLQEKKFASALRQSIALDKRTGTEYLQILQLGRMALNNRDYEDAGKSFEYLIEKGEETPYFSQAFQLNIHTSYQEYVTDFSRDQERGEALAKEFNDGLQRLGFSASGLILELIKEYAHLLAFHLDRTDEAIEILNKGLKIPKLKAEQSGILKAELGDIYVYADDPWEATLIYSQVIEDNKTNSLGDEVKLKKAKLAYYIGNFEWAKTQLDVLKASTSKLTANDAMELSLLIGNNLNLDTTEIPLTMFSQADLLFFQNKGEMAMVILDGLMELYPYNSLVDDILFRKAKIEIQNNNDTLAAQYLKQIVDNFSYDLLGDDAMFMLAELYDYNLNKKEEAKALYRDMLTYHPGSVFIEESRNRYRELREIYPDDEIKIEEDSFMKGTIETDEL